MSGKNSMFTLYSMLFLLCAIYILSYFSRLCPAVISMDISAELGIGLQEVSMLSAATMFSYGLMQLPSGLLADAVGGKKAILFLGILSVIATLVFALSDNFSVMVGSRFFVGIGLAVTVPALTLLANNFPAASYGRASSLFLSCGGIGGIVAAPPLLFLSVLIGWRMAIVCFAILTLIMLLLIAFFIKEKPKEIKEKISTKTTFTQIKKNLVLILSSFKFWVLALWTMFTAGSFFTLVAMWWAPYLTQACGLSVVQASYVLFAASLTLFLSQPIMGYLSDTVFKCRKLPVIIGTFLGLVSIVPMALFAGEMSFTLLILQAIALLLFTGSISPLVYTMAKESFPIALAGTVIGCLNMLNPLWASFMQKAYGYILDFCTQFGFSVVESFSAASWLIVANYVVAVFLTFFMKETFVK